MSLASPDNPPLNVLYICTHNRCRSALFEAITNQLGEGCLSAKSAGSEPAGQVHPLTLQYLQQSGYSTEDLSSNSWEDSDYLQDFRPDVVITVCDKAAEEVCPLWLGDTPKIHWGLIDPSKNTDDPKHTANNFRQAIQQIEQKVRMLLPIANLPAKDRIDALAKLPH